MVTRWRINKIYTGGRLQGRARKHFFEKVDGPENFGSDFIFLARPYKRAPCSCFRANHHIFCAKHEVPLNSVKFKFIVNTFFQVIKEKQTKKMKMNLRRRKQMNNYFFAIFFTKIFFGDFKRS